MNIGVLKALGIDPNSLVLEIEPGKEPASSRCKILNHDGISLTQFISKKIGQDLSGHKGPKSLNPIISKALNNNINKFAGLLLAGMYEFLANMKHYSPYEILNAEQRRSSKQAASELSKQFKENQKNMIETILKNFNIKAPDSPEMLEVEEKLEKAEMEDNKKKMASLKQKKEKLHKKHFIDKQNLIKIEVNNVIKNIQNVMIQDLNKLSTDDLVNFLHFLPKKITYNNKEYKKRSQAIYDILKDRDDLTLTQLNKTLSFVKTTQGRIGVKGMHLLRDQIKKHTQKVSQAIVKNPEEFQKLKNDFKQAFNIKSHNSSSEFSTIKKLVNKKESANKLESIFKMIWRTILGLQDKYEQKIAERKIAHDNLNMLDNLFKDDFKTQVAKPLKNLDNLVDQKKIPKKATGQPIIHDLKRKKQIHQNIVNPKEPGSKPNFKKKLI